MSQSGDSPDTEPPKGNRSTGGQEGEQTPGPSVSYTIYECPECSTSVLGIHDESPALSCHGHELEPVEQSGIDHTDPDIRELLLEVYGMPKMTIDICHFVFETGSVSVAEAAKHFGYDRSTVSRYLGDLAEAGFLDCHTLNREEGGTVDIYEAGDVEDIWEQELVGLLDWAGQAARVMDEAKGIKADCVQREDSLDRIFWEIYQERRTL
jgi:predicted transcriptional regulator